MSREMVRTRASGAHRAALACVLLLLVFVIAGGVGAATAASHPSKAAKASRTSAASCPPYSLSQVRKAVGRPDFIPVFRVPSCIGQKHLYFAFINPGQSLSPIFVDWTQAMNRAAKFYGITFRQVDLGGHFDQITNAYNELTLGKKPNLIGALAPTTNAIIPLAQAAGIPFLSFDRMWPGAYYFGTLAAQFGKIGGTDLGANVAKRMSGSWKGRSLLFMDVTQSSDDGIEKEMAIGKKFFTQKVTPASSVEVDTQVCDEADGQAAVSAALTAHPNQAIAILACNDEAGVGAYNAAAAAGRLKDIALVTMGGDSLAKQTMQSDKSGAYVGAVYVDPYQEGWSWFDAAIAIYLHKHFTSYPVHQLITPASLK